MQNPELTFDRACSEWDSRRLLTFAIDENFALSSQLDVLDRLIKSTKKEFWPGRSLEIYTSILDDDSCDKFADVKDFIGIIGISRGMALLPLDIFRRVFSHPNVFPASGVKEEISEQHRDGFPARFDQLFERRSMMGRSRAARAPNDAKRELLAELCAATAWLFVAVHEFSHIISGHVEYARAKHGLRFISEGAASKSVEFHALEVLADSDASKFSLHTCLWQPHAPPFHQLMLGPRDRLRGR